MCLDASQVIWYIEGMKIIQCLSILLLFVSINFPCSPISAQSNCCPVLEKAPKVGVSKLSPEEIEVKRRDESLARLTCIFESKCYSEVELKPVWQDFQRNITFSAWMDTITFESRDDSLYCLISEVDAYVNHLKTIRYNSGDDTPLHVEENLQAKLFSVVMKEAYRLISSGESSSRQKTNTVGIIFAHASIDSTSKYLSEIDHFASAGIFKLSALAIVIDNILQETAGVTLYGTKFDARGDSVIFVPILDKPHLAQRRKDFGLPPFEHYKKVVTEFKRNNSF